ncbi:MAG TPA: thioredoxin-disulfide reductase [bacterium]|nr:thioredoxin-disulfide reductase [bacterium]
MYDVAIIGGGPAGLTAGIYTSRALLKTVIIEKGPVGGLMSLTDKLENWPGVLSISGTELSEKMYEQATSLGCEFVNDEVIGIARLFDDNFKVSVGSGDTVVARTIIYAAGSIPKYAGFEGEKEFIGKGISYCAVCDAAFYRNLKVAVLGGGNSALKEALYLTKFASEVTIIHRRQEFRAEKIIQEQVRNHPKIKLILDSVIEKVAGSQFVEKVTIKNVKTEKMSEISADGVFVFVGYTPQVEPVKNLVKFAKDGRIEVNSHMETEVPGLFAAGDVISKLVNQVATAVGDGATAATAAEHYLATLK